LAETPIDETPLARRLLVALVTPVILLIAAGTLLGIQVSRMAEDARWVDHSDEVIGKTYEVEKVIIDQETGFRGYIITADRLFLEPYLKAKPLDILQQLSVLVADSPEQEGRATSIARRYSLWLGETAGIVATGPTEEARSLAEMTLRKAHMDDIRNAVDDMMSVERALRHERSVTAGASARTTQTGFYAILGALAVVLAFFSRKQIGDIARTFTSALARERDARSKMQAEDWVRRGHVQLAEAIQGDRPTADVAERALSFLARYLHADVGAFYAMDAGGWARRAGFALDSAAAGPAHFKTGEGLVGQAASEKQIRRIKDVPPNYLEVRSGTGQHRPLDLLIVPACTDDAPQAVVELGFLREADAQALSLLDRIGETVAVAVRSAEFRARLQDLLEESQRQGDELQTQQEELQVANEELQSQSDALRLAHAQLEERKEELEASNASLVLQRNGLERAQKLIEEKAAEVDRASRYKSEFLANMSHELRTPLNSSLILAKLLAANKTENLTPEQVKFATMIYDAGNDLLTLINDILDLSKVEAGKIEVRLATVTVSRLADEAVRTLEPQAREKRVGFAARVEPTAPATIETDGQRLQQILKNLLSNALKFTEAGEVSLTVRGVGDRIEFAVRDTGIGIAPEQHEAVFEAFRQADGTTNRRFGGTGLGLSISRNLARLLGGDLTLESHLGEGSTFTLSLPHTYPGAAASGAWPPSPGTRPGLAPLASPAPPLTPLNLKSKRPHAASVPDDRDSLDSKRRTVLLVEDDPSFATVLVDLAHELDFQCLVAHTADEGVSLALEYVPSAVVLDVQLPDHSGLSVLDRLKRSPTTRHVPIHVVSASDFSQEALSMGAAGYMLKPVHREDLLGAFRKLEDQFSRRVRRVLVVEDDDRQRESIAQLLGADDVQIVGVSTVSQALEKLRSTTFDCVVTDLSLPDATGDDLIEKMASDDKYAFPPVIVYTGRSLSPDEEQRLRKHSSSIIVKGARSPERLLDEVTLFLHRVESELPADQRRMLRQALDREHVFEGKKILVAEDDVRNVFALTSVLEPKGVVLIVARNGREALEALEKTPGVQLVLMDIMMPEMDGLEAMREIRKRPKWSKLPIIALTAKAMRDDQERCLQAGANDYISKPLDVEMLLSLLRVWMPK